MVMSMDMKAPIPPTEEAKSPLAYLEDRGLSRKASLTDTEMAFLSALLIDNPPDVKTLPISPDEERTPLLQEQVQQERAEQAARVLDNEMLFTVPQNGVPIHGNDHDGEHHETTKRTGTTKKPRQYRFLVGLWQAYEDGVSPKKLRSLHHRSSKLETIQQVPDDENTQLSTHDSALPEKTTLTDTEETESLKEDGDSVLSDQEVFDQNDNLSDISWDDEDVKRFDAWQVLKDEYASDFGFDYSPDGTFPSEDDTEMEPNTFKILGTSAEDLAAHPHVLSPPLMDALLNFVPEHIKGQNLWMKYSLVRDGASLDTFKQYARASKETILAIETTKGQVFGCYVSRPWRTAPSFFGGAPSYVFRMRHNRNSPCHCLLEQAQLETEIDVYFLLEDGQRPQVCTHDMIGVGQGFLRKYNEFGDVITSMEEEEDEKSKNYGFAIALNDDLLSGTSSKCLSYKSPCLVNVNSTGEPFEVLNLELWTFTPCFSLDTAEQLEMTQFFVQESIRNMSAQSTGSDRSNFSSRDLSRDQFYRRVGRNDGNEEIREQWHYRNMMDGVGVAGPRAMGATPRFQRSPS